MCAVDRSKFRKTTASQLVQSDRELNKTMGKKDKGNGHEVEDGRNLFRLYPVHPDVAENNPSATFAQPLVQTFLPQMVQEYKDGTAVMEHGKPKMREGVRLVYNAKVHGNTPKDLVEEYIRLANAQAKTMNLSKEDREEYLKPVYGKYSKDKTQNVQGINYPQIWVLYADKYPAANASANPVFDELRIKKSIKERLNKLAAIEAANDPLGTDPFTDINEGRAIVVVKDLEASDPKNIYTTELDTTQTTEVHAGKTFKVNKTFPLSDAQLEKFMQAEPLFIKYGKKLATRKNFENQLAGLEYLDAKWEMGIFELPEWNKIVQECDSYYPEHGEVAENVTATQSEEIEEAEEVSGDEFDLMDRNELKTFAKDNRTGILIKPTDKDDEVRVKLREWKVNAEIPHKDLPTDNIEEAEEVEETKAEQVQPQLSSRDRLAALRAKTKVLETADNDLPF